MRGISSFGRATGLQPVGGRFDPDILHQLLLTAQSNTTCIQRCPILGVKVLRVLAERLAPKSEIRSAR